jgi:glycine C-acetyltransferase
MTATPTSRRRPRVTGPGVLPVDPFDGYFADDRHRRPAPGSIADRPAGRHWFEVVGWGRQAGLYTYQQPLDGRTAPRVTIEGRPLLMLAAYDYLGLVGHPAIEEAAMAAIRRYGTATGGVRMLTGTVELHRELERELAEFKGVASALSFTSGYVANLAAVSALVGPGDRVLLDERAHRSLRDACVLSGAAMRTFRHNDSASLERALRQGPAGRRTLIAVDGLYSMDGDVCRLAEFVELKRRAGALLLVDDAHALGVLGARGRGVHEHAGLAPDAVDVWTGSLSKAIPANGGFVAGGRDLVIYLQHAAAPFWFSAALCPPAAAAALEALRVVRREPERLVRLRQVAARLRDGLRGLGYDTGGAESAIIPVIVGDNRAAWRLARRLLDRGVVASAVVPPAVPRGTARLRLCATAALSSVDLATALDAFAAVRNDGPGPADA